MHTMKQIFVTQKEVEDYQPKTIVQTTYITPSRSIDVYNDGMVFYNDDGLYFSIYESVQDYYNDELPLESFDSEEEAEYFIQHYTL